MSSNTYGRGVWLPLTNQSGGGVINGDVVMIDSANNNSFTTNSSNSWVGGVGVAQGTIGASGVGLIAISGYVSLINVNGSNVTRGNFARTALAKGSASAGATRTTGTFAQFLTGGTTPDALMWPSPDTVSAAGNVATDPIWDAAGDLAVGTGANTAAKLVVGAAGGALSVINGAVAWNSGTAFPGSKLTGDRYWRTDLGLECYWDGTRWLTKQLFREPMTGETTIIPVSATGSHLRWQDWAGGTYDVWLVQADLMTYHGSITGSNYWSIQLIKGTTAEAETNVGSAVVTSSDTSANWTPHTVTIGALLGTTYRYIRASETKNGSATQLYIHGMIQFRLVIT